MKDYQQWYSRLRTTLELHPIFLKMIIIYNNCLTKMMYILYPILLIFISYSYPKKLLQFIVIPAIFFILVSIVRKWLNQPRPYETMTISPILKRDGKGESYPSRHVFSATIISMCFLEINLWIGCILLFLSFILAICRVIGGVHYPRDVITGIIVGILCGLLVFI